MRFLRNITSFRRIAQSIMEQPEAEQPSMDDPVTSLNELRRTMNDSQILEAWMQMSPADGELNTALIGMLRHYQTDANILESLVGMLPDDEVQMVFNAIRSM